MEKEQDLTPVRLQWHYKKGHHMISTSHHAAQSTHGGQRWARARAW